MIYKTEVISKKRLAPDIFELTLKPISPKSVKFIAGQYVPFIIGNHTRIYSMASPPNSPGELSFCIDVSPNGLGSKYVKKLKAGDEVRFNDPLGFFTADERNSDILFIAMGVGIAPFKSIIPDLLASNFRKSSTLLFGVHSEESIIYEDFFSRLEREHKNFKFELTLSKPGRQWKGNKGRVTDFLQKESSKFKKCLVYICGAPGAVADVQDHLLELGFVQGQLRMELFQ